MSKQFVAYFSASGVTAEVAKRLAEATGAALYEIRPETPYTNADLDWMNQQSRSSVEMKDKDCRPPLADNAANVAEADVIFVGFPIWWYREPSVIDTFLEAYDFGGKTIVPFATSGTSGMGDTAQRMQEIAGTDVTVLDGARFKASISVSELKAWTEGLGI